MTDSERSAAVCALNESLLENDGVLKLSKVPAVLQTAGIDRTVYGGTGLKRWLGDQFPEFVIEGTGGSEVLYPAGGTQSAPVSAQLDLLEEVRQMHAFAYMSWWTNNLKRFRQFNDYAELDSSKLRDEMAHQVALALLGQEGRLLEAIDDDIPRVAIPTGKYDRDGVMIYCVLGVNPKNEDGTKQYMSLLGFCCPWEDDADGLGKWLGSRFSLEGTRRTGSVSYDEMREQATQLDAARQILIPLLQDYISRLEEGQAPEGGLPERLEAYEAQWTALQQMLTAFWGLTDMASLRLADLETMLDEKEAKQLLVKQALEYFDQIWGGMRHLYERDKLSLPENGQTVPDRDREELQRRYAAVSDGTDLTAFREILGHYRDLHTVMTSEKLLVDTTIQMADYFQEIPYKHAVHGLVNTPEDARFLSRIDDIFALLDKYEAMDRREEPQPAPVVRIGVDELFTMAVHPGDTWPLDQIRLLRGALPEGELEQALVFGDLEKARRLLPLEEQGALEGLSGAATFCGAANRLLAVCGNRDRLAEKYLLLGLGFDAKRCVPALLRLYRESGQAERFREIWTHCRSLTTISSNEDTIYWLAIQCSSEDASNEDWDDLETFLIKHPNLLRSSGGEHCFQRLTPQLQRRPAAFWAWLGVLTTPSNSFEAALEENDREAIYAQLDDRERMVAMGYQEQEISALLMAMQQSIPVGMDSYSKAQRLLAVEKDRPAAAEKWLWAAEQNQNAALDLFDLYYAKGDHASVCWIAKHFSMQFAPFDRRTDAYIRSLVESRGTQTLAALMRRHPILWYREGVLELLAGQEDAEDQSWSKVLRWHTEHPFADICPFEAVLAAGDFPAMRILLADRDQMVQWGYPEELQNRMLALLEESGSPAEQSGHEAIERISAFQGNLHRFLERCLRQALEKEPEWGTEQLFRLFVSQGRHLEATAYYEAYPSIASSEQCTTSYLWSLVTLQRLELLLERAAEAPRCLLHDSKLAEEIFRIAAAAGKERKIAELQHTIRLLPRNRFEESIIHLNSQALQQMLGDSAQMLELGYSGEEIQRFKDCISRPYSIGSDRYSVASRVRTFLGDARAEPFLLESNSPRSARMLFSIYSAAKRWDDLCCLYRRHSDGELWDNNDKRTYEDALPLATLPENCQAFLDLIDGQPAGKKNSAKNQWLYLRALLGAGHIIRAEEQEERILNSGARFMPDIAGRYLDMLWDSGDDGRKEHAVLFASQLLSAYDGQLSHRERKLLVSVNRRLLEEADRKRWVVFLRKNDLNEMLWLLNCCYLFDIAGADGEREAFTRITVERLCAEQSGAVRQELAACWEYAAQIPEEERAELMDCLLARSFELLDPNRGPSSERDWKTFLDRLSGVPLTPEQHLAVAHMWHNEAMEAEDLNVKERLLFYGMQLYSRLGSFGRPQSGPDKAEISMSGGILDIWLSLLEQGKGMSEAFQEIFAAFWREARPMPEQLRQLDAAWTSILSEPEEDEERLSRKLSFAVIVTFGGPAFEPTFLRLLVDALLSLLGMSDLNIGQETLDLAGQVLERLGRDEMSRIVRKLPENSAFANDALRDMVSRCCENRWPDLLYQWNKLGCRFFDSNEEKRVEMLEQLRKSAARLDAEQYATFDDNDLKLLYEAVCKDVSVHNICLLRSIYQAAGKAECTEILTALETGDWQGEQPKALREWFERVLETRDMSWFDRYSHWWAPLVRLSPDDQQTKVMSDYLGLNGELAETSYRDSITRLLLSDMKNLNYQRCYLRLSSDLPLAAVGKLECIGAKSDPGQIDASVRKFLEREQYEFAVDLLLYKMSMPVYNSSILGQLLGDLYTEHTLEVCPALEGFVQEIYTGIQKVNNCDPQGTWKNIGRAVDIACITRKENCFFETFGESVLLEHPGKCAAVIANLVLRKEFADAQRWLVLACAQSNNRYLVLLEHIVGRCMESGVLSHRDELLVRSIPREGNQTTLESYGELVRFAFSRGWEKDCAGAFAELSKGDPADKALFASCIQLYMAGREEFDVYFLYGAAQNYFKIVQDSQIFRAAKALAVIRCCLPNQGQGSDSVAMECMPRFIGMENCNQHLSAIADLEHRCRDFLNAEGDRAAREDILLRAATGWWKLDYDVIRLLEPWEDLMRTLVTIYPVSFSAACFCSALSFQSDTKYQSRIQTLLLDGGRECDLSRCSRHFSCVGEITPPRIPAMKRLLDCPVELPGLYQTMFEEVLKGSDPAQMENEITIILAIQPHFSYESYQNNIYHLKEKVDAAYPECRRTVLKVMTQLSVGDFSTGHTQNPAAYLDMRNYLMVVNAAERRLQEIQESPPAKNQRFLITLNQTYLKLGKILTGQLDGSEKQITLTEFLNMANLLCQSESYKDLHILMGLCAAKWKICIRCVQELVQGRPSNIAYVLRKKEFQTHTGTLATISKFARQFVDVEGKNNIGQNLLLQENRRRGRPWNWGFLDEKDIPDMKGFKKKPQFLLNVTKLNYQELSSFQEDINNLLREMRKEELLDGSRGLNEAHSSEIYEAYRSFRTIPYVIEQVQRWPMDDLSESDDVNQRRDELSQALQQAATNEEFIECCGKLIALDWNSDGSTTICWYCIEMGLRLFEERCKVDGLAVHATPEAREILYSMTPCLQGATVQGAAVDKIKTGLQNCLMSYNDLSTLISDCNQPYMLELCKVITDSNVQKSLRNYIQFVRGIGKTMGTSMTNMERLNTLKDYIAKCRSTMTNFDSGPKQQLILLLNNQIGLLQGMAHIVVTVYNDTSTWGSGRLFGKVENLGRQDVSNIRIELSLDGVVCQQYFLGSLAGNSMVPFDFAVASEEGCKSLTYSLATCFVTGGGEEEQALPVEGTLRLENPEELDCSYSVYKVDAPVDKENYTERKNLENVLNAIYGAQNSFGDLPNLAMYGMKRMGKTSVMRRLGRMLEERSKNELCKDKVRYVEASGEGAAGSLPERIHAILIKQVLAKLQNHFRSDPGWAAFSAQWEHLSLDADTFKMEWLDDFYLMLDKNWLSEYGLVVLVDEAENLLVQNGGKKSSRESALDQTASEPEDEHGTDADLVGDDSGGSNLWNILSRITQRENSRIRFVFCGSDFFTNKIVEGDNLTQFFQRIKKLSVGRMDRIELERTIRSIESKKCGISFQKDTIEYLWDLTGGLPWHSKLIVNSVIEQRLIHEEGSVRGTIYPSDINWGAHRILNDVVACSDNNFGLIALSADEQQLLQLLTAELKTPSAQVGDSVLRQRFHEAVGDESWQSRYERAKKMLLSERQMLRRNRMDQEEQFRFGCEFYRLYNRHEKPRQFIIR